MLYLRYQKEKGRNLLKKTILLSIVALLITVVLVACTGQPPQDVSTVTPTAPPYYDDGDLLATFAQEHNLSLSEWPDKLIDLLERNPETAEYVLHYPLKKDLNFEIDLQGHINNDRVPLLFQWDERWGYTKYGNDMMGLTGCGPTCLSMVCLYLLDDPKYSPRYIADFAIENGYCVPGNGSSWTLISKGGVTLGLDVTELPLDKNRIIRNLQVGNPIICVMGPGDFTSSGHFIVMTGYVNGKISVNDPNSPNRSEKLWDYEAIKDQIRNLWACRVK